MVRLRIWLWGPAVAAVLWSGWAIVQRHIAGTSRDPAADSRPVSGETGLKILNFYARDGAAFEGAGTPLCYGVENATAVRIDPPVGDVYPAQSKCVQVVPNRDTRYTLTAQDAGGHTASASFLLTVKPAPETLPKIATFDIRSHRVVDGRDIYSLYFWVENSVEISIDPPVFAPHASRFGFIPVAPTETTVYTLTATGKTGYKAQRKLTVAPPAR